MPPTTAKPAERPSPRPNLSAQNAAIKARLGLLRDLLTEIGTPPAGA